MMAFFDPWSTYGRGFLRQVHGQIHLSWITLDIHDQLLQTASDASTVQWCCRGTAWPRPSIMWRHSILQMTNSPPVWFAGLAFGR